MRYKQRDKPVYLYQQTGLVRKGVLLDAFK